MAGELALTSNRLSLREIADNRNFIAKVIKAEMKEGLHYGMIPGCGKKPALFLPGAQIIGNLYQVRPDYQIFEKELPDNHREFRLTCTIRTTIGGLEVSQGVGLCSSMEAKYRYRNNGYTSGLEWTGDPVPKTFYKIQNSQEGGKKAAMEWLEKQYGPGATPRKNDEDVWEVAIYKKEKAGKEIKAENPNLADILNTVLKMAKKRAFVDAIITMAGVSDYFTQDLEDMRTVLAEVEILDADYKQVKPGKKEKKTAQPKAPKIDKWENVICHIGKKDGEVRGKALGTLRPQQIKSIVEHLQKVNPKKLTTDDIALLAACRLAFSAPVQEEMPITSLAKLNELVVQEAWDFQKFMQMVVDNEFCKGASFNEITEAEAAAILERSPAFLAEMMGVKR